MRFSARRQSCSFYNGTFAVVCVIIPRRAPSVKRLTVIYIEIRARSPIRANGKRSGVRGRGKGKRTDALCARCRMRSAGGKAYAKRKNTQCRRDGGSLIPLHARKTADELCYTDSVIRKPDVLRARIKCVKNVNETKTVLTNAVFCGNISYTRGCSVSTGSRTRDISMRKGSGFLKTRKANKC